MAGALAGAAVGCGSVHSATDAGDDPIDASVRADAPTGPGVDAAQPPADAADAGACATPPCVAQVADVPLDGKRDLDVLFVIDNSGTMAPRQASLVTNFNRFINVLANAEGGLPNLHIGVVSTNLGAGPYGIQNCGDVGDQGILQSIARGACNPPSDRFISDVDDGQGGRNTNYIGTLADTFGCIAALGSDGCGFEQSLEAMRRALNGSNPENSGFLRSNALLSVVMLTDEDDCSTQDVTMFDISDAQLELLGPLSSFRCFEFGVECNPDDPRSFGPKQGCRSREDSPYMFAVANYVSFLRGLKADPRDVSVSVIAASPTPVVVEADQSFSNPSLAASCTGIDGEGDPAVRLAGFVAGFSLRGAMTSVCGDDLSVGLALAADQVSARLGNVCLVGALSDTDSGTVGVQPSCEVEQVASGGARTALPECDNPGNPGSSGNQPCYAIAPDLERCLWTQSGLSLRVYRASPPAAGTSLSVRCAVD